MSENKSTDQELAEEARRWDSGELTPAGWEDATDVVPRAKASESISLRLPKPMLAILKEFAKRADIGYQVLIKRWLDDRIRAERDQREQLGAASHATGFKGVDLPFTMLQAASFDDKSVIRLTDDAGTDMFGKLAALAVNK